MFQFLGSTKLDLSKLNWNGLYIFYIFSLGKIKHFKYYIFQVHVQDNDKCIQVGTLKADKEIQTVYEKEVLNAKIENMLLKNQMRTQPEQENITTEAPIDTSLSLKAIKKDGVKMKHFTGLTYELFLILFTFLGDSVHSLTYLDGKVMLKKM